MRPGLQEGSHLQVAGGMMEKQTDRPAGAGGETRSVVMVGVGGQGTILAANLLARVLVAHGFDVKTSEVHGMAQRGGSVVSMVRFGDRVASPLVPAGSADVMIATEMLEALRNLHYLSPEGKLIASETRVDPLSVLQGAARYPEDARDMLRERFADVVLVDAREVASRCGNARAANTVLLGVLSAALPVGVDEWLSVMEEVVPGKALEANREAFLAGRELA